MGDHHHCHFHFHGSENDDAIVARLTAIEEQMTKTSDALAALAAAETSEEGEVSTLLADFTTQGQQLTALQTQVAALQQNPDDTTTADAVNATIAQMQATRDKIASTLAPASSGADTTGGGDTTSASTSGGQGSDTISGGNGSDSLSGGNAGDSFDTSGGAAAPVAVVSTDPTVIQQVPGDTAPPAVIVTDHPTSGDVLVTPVTSTDPVPAGSITVDPTSGVPTADPASGVTLGATAPAPNQDAASSAADMATADPTAVVSAPQADS